MAQTQVGIKLTLDGAQQVEQGVRRVISSVDSLGTQFTRLGQLAAGAFSVRELVTAADAYATLTGRIKLASEGLGNAAQAQKQLFDIANTARTSVEGLSNTYASLARAAGESGRSQAELLRTTDTLAKAMTIGGGAAESQKAALMQFAQGLSAGTLRGEELNSVMEQAPRLAKALADGLGVPTGALKTLAEEGRITADAIFEALERSRAKIEQEFTQLPTTIGQALTVLNNSFMQTIGVFDETNKISSGFADAILGIGKNMDVVVPTVGAMAAGLVVLRTSATAAAVATGALGTAVGALGGPIGLIATALGIGVTAWAAWKGAATDSEKAVETQVINSDAEIQSRIDAQIGKLRERNRLATEGMPEARTGVERAAADAASLYSGQLSRYQQIQSGAGEFANLTDATRAALLQASAKSMAKAYSQYTELTAETAKQAETKNRETFEKFTKGYKSAQDKAKEELAKYEKEFKPKIGIGITQAEYDAGYKAIEERTKKTATAVKATKELSDAEKQALGGLELYSNLIAETAGFQGDYAEKVSQLAEAYAKNKISLEGLTFAHGELLKKQPAAVEATKMEAEARKVLTDAVIASARAYEEAQQAMDALQADTWQMVNDTVKASKDSAAAVQFELGLIGQTTEARRIAIEQRKIELNLEEQIKKVKATPFEGGEEAQLREINRLREAAAQDSATAISRIQLDEAAKSVEQYDKIFREGFAAMIAGGKDSWKSFTKSLTATFKTAVVDQIYKAFMQPFVVNVVANVAGITGLGGAGGAAGAGNSLANGIQTASSLNTLYGTASQAIYGATAGATAASLGYANAVGMVGGDALGALIAANGSWAGVATGSAAAAEAAIAANLAMEAGAAVALEAGTMAAAVGTQAATAATAAASTASSLMSTVATAMPYLAAASALGMIAKSFDDSGTLHMGAGAIYQKGRLREGRDIYGQELFNMGLPGEYNANAQANVSGVASAIGNALDTVATSFGKKAGYEIATAFADDSSGDGAWGALRISQGGQDLINWQDTRTSRWAPKEFADGEEGYKQYLAAVAKDTRQVLLGMDLPGWAKTVFNELGDSPSIETLAKSIEQVGRFNGVLEAMGENVLPALADASDSAITALVKAAGGTDALTASMVNYYNSTATDLDRQQYAFKTLNTALKEVGDLRPQALDLSDSPSDLFGGLGADFATAIMGGLLTAAAQGALPELKPLTLPEGDVKLREWYNGLVEAASALDLNVQGNADYLAGLLALSPAVDSLAEAWDASLEGIFGSTTLGALANAALRGDAFATAVINAAGGLEAFGEAITGYYDNFYTEGERAAMTTAQITKELAKVGETMPKTREEFRALMDEHVAMGEAGQPVVNALLKVQDAFASVTEPIAEAAAAVETVEQAYTRLTTVNRTAEDVVNERISLEDRLFNATANAAQVAEKARNAIDPMNQALYDTVIAAERLKEATENLPDALESSLGRAPVQEELSYWIGQVASGAMTLQDAMTGITRDGATEKLALQLLELTDAEGYLAETRKRQLSTMTPLQQEIQKQIWAKQDEKKAAEAAAASAKAIADQRLGLEGQLLTLQGNTAELRRRELALLDQSNQALQQRIWALEDLKAAEDAYNAALSERDNAKSAVDRVLGEATSAYLNAVQEQASAAQRVADLHRQAAEKMLSAGKSLRQYLTGELVSNSDPLTSQRVAQSEFSALLGRANAGDTEAYGQLSDAARTLLDKSREVMGQGEFDRVRASVLRSLQSAADAADAAAAASIAKAGPQADPMTEALAALQSADSALAEALRVATTIGAPLTQAQRDLIAEYQKAKDTLVQAEDKLAKALDALNDIKKNTGDTVKAIGELKIKLEAIDLGASATIDFILGSDLPADLKELALGGPRTVQATVDYLLGNLDSIPKPLMDVVLGTLTQFDVTTNFLVGSALPDDLKRLALTASDRVIKNTYDFLTGTTLTDDLKQLAVLSSGTISRTINFVAGSAELTDAQKKVAFSTLGDYTTTVKAVLDSTMPASIKKVVLDGVGVYEASVKAAAASDLPASLKKVLFDGAGDYLTTIKSTLDSSLTADQKELLLNATSSAQRVINMSVTGGTLNDEQKTFLNTAAGTINRALALTASGGSLTPEQSSFLGYAAATVNRVLSLSASGGSLTPDQQAILNAVNGTTNASVTANVSGTVNWTNSTVETYLFDIKNNTGKLATDIYAAYTSVTGLKLPNTGVHEALRAVSSSSTAVKAGVYAQLRLAGYTDSLIRAVADGELGKQTDTDWAALKKLAGYSSGGYTGPGGMYEPAGIVHKGEVVWSQADIARAGGVAAVEAARVGGLSGYADGGVVAASSFTPPTYTPPIAVRQGISDTTALERRMDAVVQELRESRRESARQIRILEQQLMEQSRMATDLRGISNNGVQVFTDPKEPLDTKSTEAVPA